MKPPPVSAAEHVDGPEHARITLIEYADFECPFCVQAHPVIEAVREAYRSSLRFVFRHVMRSPAAGFAKQAAEVSELAAAHGRFWEMHGQLFLHPGEHEPDQLVGYAEIVGLDPEECRAALSEHRLATRVRELATEAARSGIIATPTLFINEERYQDRIEPQRLAAALDRVLAGGR